MQINRFALALKLSLFLVSNFASQSAISSQSHYIERLTWDEHVPLRQGKPVEYKSSSLVDLSQLCFVEQFSLDGKILPQDLQPKQNKTVGIPNNPDFVSEINKLIKRIVSYPLNIALKNYFIYGNSEDVFSANVLFLSENHIDFDGLLLNAVILNAFLSQLNTVLLVEGWQAKEQRGNWQDLILIHLLIAAKHQGEYDPKAANALYFRYLEMLKKNRNYIEFSLLSSNHDAYGWDEHCDSFAARNNSMAETILYYRNLGKKVAVMQGGSHNFAFVLLQALSFLYQKTEHVACQYVESLFGKNLKSFFQIDNKFYEKVELIANEISQWDEKGRDLYFKKLSIDFNQPSLDTAIGFLVFPLWQDMLCNLQTRPIYSAVKNDLYMILMPTSLIVK